MQFTVQLNWSISYLYSKHGQGLGNIFWYIFGVFQYGIHTVMKYQWYRSNKIEVLATVCCAQTFMHVFIISFQKICGVYIFVRGLSQKVVDFSNSKKS